MSAPKLTALATLVDSGDRFVTIDAGYAGHFDLHFNERIPVEIAALNGRRNAVRVTVEPVDAPAPAPPRSAEEIAREMVPDAGWLQLGTDGVRLASDVSVPHARSIIARTIGQARADGAAAALAGQQPRDLAGRIRALIQAKAGEWADVPVGEAWRRSDVFDLMQHLRKALIDVRDRELTLMQRIQDIRDEAYGDRAEMYRQAADELETIERECAGEEKR